MTRTKKDMGITGEKTTTVTKKETVKRRTVKKKENEKIVEKKPLPDPDSINLDENRWKTTYANPEKEESKDNEKETLTPAQYFEKVKESVNNETEENIRRLYDITKKCLERYVITHQKAAAKDCYARCQSLVKEFKLVELGITKWVERSVIDTFIDDVADECVCIIEMANYPRPIPEEIIDKISETVEIFDQFFIIFTDYTGEQRKKVAKEKRDKDPILFGNIFIDGKVSNKMYFIGDWEDEYCDLTLSQMISKMAEKYDGEIVHDINEEQLSMKEIEEKIAGKVKAKNIHVGDVVN